MQELPTDILDLLTSTLDTRSIIYLASTCRQICRYLLSNAFWAKKFMQRYAIVPDLPKLSVSYENYKRLYSFNLYGTDYSRKKSDIAVDRVIFNIHLSIPLVNDNYYGICTVYNAMAVKVLHFWTGPSIIFYIDKSNVLRSIDNMDSEKFIAKLSGHCHIVQNYSRFSRMRISGNRYTELGYYVDSTDTKTVMCDLIEPRRPVLELNYGVIKIVSSYDYFYILRQNRQLYRIHRGTKVSELVSNNIRDVFYDYHKDIIFFTDNDWNIWYIHDGGDLHIVPNERLEWGITNGIKMYKILTDVKCLDLLVTESTFYHDSSDDDYYSRYDDSSDGEYYFGESYGGGYCSSVSTYNVVFLNDNYDLVDVYGNKQYPQYKFHTIVGKHSAGDGFYAVASRIS